MRTVTKNRSRSGDTYFDLVRAFPLRRITSAAQHTKAKQVVLALSMSASGAGTRDYVDVLTDLVADYEKRAGQTLDTSRIPVAQIIRHRLQEQGLSASALAQKIGIPQPHLSAMLNGRRDWSKSAIRALSKRFNIRAERFLV